jgi:hypothetical protein
MTPVEAIRKLLITARAHELPKGPMRALVALSVFFQVMLIVAIIKVMKTGQDLYNIDMALLLPISFTIVTVLYMAFMKEKNELSVGLLAMGTTGLATMFFFLSVFYSAFYPDLTARTYALMQKATGPGYASEWGLLVASTDGSLNTRTEHRYDGMELKQITHLLSAMNPIAKLKGGRVYVTFRLPAQDPNDLQNHNLPPAERMTKLVDGSDCFADWQGFRMYADGLGGFVDSPVMPTVTVDGVPFKGLLPPCGQMIAFSVQAWGPGNPG